MTPPRPIIAIDMLRFACAMLVVAHHFDVAFWIFPSPRSARALAHVGARFAGSDATRIGWIGVELFFVISGLVIARSAVGLSPLAFLRRRALRLLPGAWACATITAAAMIETGLGGSIAVPWLRSVAFWPIGEQVDGSYWTLGIEGSFYLVMALAIASGADGARIERAGIAVGLLSTAFWAAWLGLGHGVGALPGDRYVMLALLPHGCFFAIGVLIAAVHDRPTLRRAGLLALFTLTATVEIGQHVLERAEAGIVASPMLAQSVFLGGLALLASAHLVQPWLVRWIDSATARTIGLMTYPLYLLHQDVGAALLGALAATGLPVRIAAGLSVAAMLAASWAVATWAEPPLRRILSALLAMPRRGLAPDRRPSAFPPVG